MSDQDSAQSVSHSDTAKFAISKAKARQHLLSIIQAAKELGLSRMRVYQLAKNGSLNAGRAYDKLMVTTDSVNDYKSRRKDINSHDSHSDQQ